MVSAFKPMPGELDGRESSCRGTCVNSGIARAPHSVPDGSISLNIKSLQMELGQWINLGCYKMALCKVVSVLRRNTRLRDFHVTSMP